MNKELLKILRCPKCGAKLNVDKEKTTLICTKCKAIYTIKDNIPNMLVEKDL